MMFDGKAFGQEVVETVKSYLAREVAPLLDRIAALEKNLAEHPPPVAPDVATMVRAEGERIAAELSLKNGAVEAALANLESAIAQLAVSVPGGDDIKALVDEAVSALPPAAPGKDADPIEVAEIVKAEVEAQVKALPPAPAGKDADPVEVEAKIAEAVKAAVAALPKPQDGKSISVDDLRTVIAEEVSKAAAAIPIPKDGAGLADALIDREGQLVITMTDGRAKHLGRVIGDRGEPGLDGVSMKAFETEVLDDGRTIALKFMRGDDFAERHEIKFPVLLDRGVWKEAEFETGDVVTWGGSLWIAQRSTTQKPDTADSGWRLAVKKGRDGKDGADGKPGERGLKGDPGRNGTSAF